MVRSNDNRQCQYSFGSAHMYKMQDGMQAPVLDAEIYARRSPEFYPYRIGDYFGVVRTEAKRQRTPTTATVSGMRNGRTGGCDGGRD